MHGESVRVFSTTAAPAALFAPAIDDAIIPCLLASPKYRDAGAKLKRVLGRVDALVRGDLLLRWRPGSVASCGHRLSRSGARSKGVGVLKRTGRVDGGEAETRNALASC